MPSNNGPSVTLWSPRKALLGLCAAPQALQPPRHSLLLNCSVKPASSQRSEVAAGVVAAGGGE